MAGEDSLDAVKKVLKEPVFIGHDARSQIVRVQLFFLSAVTIVYSALGLKINPSSSIFGLRFDGLNDGSFKAILLVVLIYMVIHFVWLSADAFLEWRLRITGTRSAFITTAKNASEHADYPNNPRQSTLYHYYSEEMLDKLSSLDSMITISSANFDNVDKQSIHANISKLIESVEDPRVSVSLRRFDNWFKYFQISQNLRWFFIEFLFPLLLGLVAIGLLVFE